jgi:hypothetical protein
MTAKFNADILARLADATPDELAGALAAIREDFGAFQSQPASDETTAAVVSLRDAALAIRAEENRRAALGATHSSALSDLGDIFAEGDGAQGEQGDGTGQASDSTEHGDQTDSTATQEAVEDQHGEGRVENPADNADAGDNDNDAGDSGGEGQETVTASGRRPLGGTHRPGATQVATLERVAYRTTASAGLDNFAPGAQLTRQDMLAAFGDKLRAVRNTPGYERYRVATIRAEYPESRSLVASGDPERNMQLVENAVAEARRVQAFQRGDAGQHALVAAGLCAPLETLYDIRTIGDTDRPVRDALVRFGADRGGIQYRPALRGVTQTGGIGFWTTDNDEADPIVPKTCVEIDCPGVVDAVVEAIYRCLTFSNMSTRFDPEFMDSVVRAQDIAHSRIAENHLLTLMTAASKNIYSEQLLGAVRDILATLDKMIAYYRNVHRLNRDTPLRWIAPVWALYLMRADMTRQMVGDGMQVMALTDEQIVSWFRARNVNPTFHLDGIDPADLTVPEPDVPVPAQFYTLLATNSPVPDFPTAISSLLFAEGDWLHLDGGTLDFGVVRDSTLIGQNRFQTFSESFEYPAFRGVESIHLVIPALPTGASAATVDITGDTGI